MEWGEIIRTILTLVSTAIVVIGWFTINRQNNQRETRKEVRKLLDDVSKELESLTDDAFRFHSSHYESLPAMKLQTKIQITIEKITRVSGVLDVDTVEQCAELRKAITYKNFDATSHQACKHDDEIIININEQLPALITPLEDAFHKKYIH